MQSKGKSVFTAAIFSLLFVIMLPLRPVSDVPNGLTITATGERNSQAKSDEVWLSTSMERAIQESATRIDDGWELRNGSLVSFRNQPATIQAKVPINEGDTLIFTMHEYSGIVEIGSGKYSRRYDLYSDTPNTLRIDLYATLPRELNLGRTLLKGILVYGAAFVFFFAISLFLARGLGSEEKKSALVSGERAKLSLWFAIPSIVIYGGVLAAYWPAQMSPDSIEQWRQIVTGEYADAHPLMSTLLYKLAFLVYPAPQAAALLQIFAYSAVTWFFLREMMAWGVPRYIVFITAVLFPAFPGNFMLVSTLWKDIPFTIGVILLSTLAAREVRQKLTLTWGSVIAMSLAGILTFGVRHNGILIVIPFFMLLFLFSKGRDKKLKVVIALASQVIVFLLMKTLLLTVFNAAPVGSHYRSIFALHVLAAMENADIPFDASDAALMYKVMPRSCIK